VNLSHESGRSVMAIEYNIKETPDLLTRFEIQSAESIRVNVSQITYGFADKANIPSLARIEPRVIWSTPIINLKYIRSRNLNNEDFCIRVTLHTCISEVSVSNMSRFTAYTDGLL
jgi:hypothetical protein